MSFGSPILLLSLFVVPLMGLVAVIARRRRARFPLAFTNLEILASVQARSSRKVWIPLVLLLLALALAATALAQPRVQTSSPEAHAVVVMLVDVSGSMQATDIRPTRIAAAVAAMQTFVGKLPKHADVGLVEFSTEPTVISPPTDQHDEITNALGYLYPQGATALGDGIEAAVAVAQQSLLAEGAHRDANGYEPAAIVLLSDGAQNRGTSTPLQAAQRARAAGIRIYPVAFGTPHGEMKFEDAVVPVPPDPATLRQVATVTGGTLFLARSAGEASNVYNTLGTAVVRTTKRHDLTSWLSLGAGVFLLAAVGAGLKLGQVLP